MSDVQKAMAILISAFKKYSGKEGDAQTLTKNELKELLNNELGGFLSASNDKASVEKIFKDLDANGDQTVDFQEFMCMVACLTVCCHEHFTSKSTK